ncbi:MAG TPA: hypothetical protein VMU77_00700 [Acidimicrobiales bacterium]|nr:hypothetical protein [Acidimicrobiales bacterium]
MLVWLMSFVGGSEWPFGRLSSVAEKIPRLDAKQSVGFSYQISHRIPFEASSLRREWKSGSLSSSEVQVWSIALGASAIATGASVVIPWAVDRIIK